jgi:hypothetical protein
MVLADGERTEAFGRLVQNALGTWFEPPLPVPATDQPISPPSHLAVPVDGASLTNVARRQERDELIEGYATVLGRWVDGLLVVEHQAPPPQPVNEPDAAPESRRIPPCPEPPGGWPRRGRDRLGPTEQGALQDSGAIVTATTYWPGPYQAVAVIAATDIVAVENTLRPILGEQLCVVPSRFTLDEITSVRQHIARHFIAWKLVTTAESSDDDAQLVIQVSATRVVPEMAAWAKTCPPGLVELESVWMAPLPSRP